MSEKLTISHHKEATSVLTNETISDLHENQYQNEMYDQVPVVWDEIKTYPAGNITQSRFRNKQLQLSAAKKIFFFYLISYLI